MLRGWIMTFASSGENWYQEVATAQIKAERSQKAELLNGRVAMLGLVIGLLTDFSPVKASSAKAPSAFLVSTNE